MRQPVPKKSVLIQPYHYLTRLFSFRYIIKVYIYSVEIFDNHKKQVSWAHPQYFITT